MCNGEILTVRIPTADDGRYIYWEFATDDYDLAFGVCFEWNKCPDPEVTLDVNDSESEDDDDFWDDDEHLTDVVSQTQQHLTTTILFSWLSPLDVVRHTVWF